LVEQAAHDSSDECSNHSGLTIIAINPSAGIGRQGELKIRWYIIVNVQVVSWIFLLIIVVKFNFYKDPLVKWLRHGTFTAISWVRSPGGLNNQFNSHNKNKWMATHLCKSTSKKEINN
jgi:hypothetical protein